MSDDLQGLFDAASSPPSKPNAKQKAIHLALKEFETVQQRAAAPAGDTHVGDGRAGSTLKNTIEKNNLNFFQGFFAALRLKGKYNPEDTKMQKTHTQNRTSKTSHQPWIYSGAATAFVGVFALLLVNFQDIDVVPSDIMVERKPSPPAPLVTTSNEDVMVIGVRSMADEADTDAEITAVLEREKLPSAPMIESRAVVSQAASSEEQIVVTGVRAELKKAMASKRKSSGVADAISAEDIGRLPEASLAESLQRIDKSKSAPLHLAPDELGVAQTVEHRNDFEPHELNPLKRVQDEPVSTFSVDVDTASYSFVRRSLSNGHLPPKDAVRIEELVNYFDYAYPQPATTAQPFATHVRVMDSPWAEGRKLMHIGIQGYDLPAGTQPRSNLVFLLDVSGSMSSPDKLPLVKQSMSLLLTKLRADDTVAIVVYAGAAGTVLEPTKVKNKADIMAALNRLSAGGSTAGAQGIELAYQLAEQNFDSTAVNRIVLATDGDFNVGITDREALKGFVERKRSKGIYLSVLGFGDGNYQDHMMQTLAQNGNGIAAYIDTLSEAQKVLVTEATSSLFPIAKDVKIQVEFNPNTVSEYRLIGYETRALKREDFNNDKVDAGDIGAGHSVTAIYEITPRTAEATMVDALRYGDQSSQDSREEELVRDDKRPLDAEDQASEYAFVKIRYKLPESNVSTLIETPVAAMNTVANKRMVNADSEGLYAQEAQFATAVAGFAQLLKNDKYLGEWQWQDALELAQQNRGDDPYGYRAEFVQLIRKAMVASEL